MTKRWIFIFLGVFLPTVTVQVSAAIAVLLGYWIIHMIYRPYREDWPIYANLENDYQNFLYGFELIILITLWSYWLTDANGLVITIILMLCYFTVPFILIYCIICVRKRLNFVQKEPHAKGAKDWRRDCESISSNTSTPSQWSGTSNITLDNKNGIELAMKMDSKTAYSTVNPLL
jgi:hypothetical protein